MQILATFVLVAFVSPSPIFISHLVAIRPTDGLALAPTATVEAFKNGRPFSSKEIA